MCELPMSSAAIGTNEGPEICADILWSQVVAVDAALVGGQLEQAPYDPLVPLVLLDPAPHRRRIAPRLQTLRTGAPSLLGARGERARDPARARARPRRGGGCGSGEQKARLFCCCWGCFAARAITRGREKNLSLVASWEEEGEEEEEVR